MSTNRTSKQAGYIDQARMPRGPNGRGLCRRCGAEVPKGNRTFCSAACVHEWRVKTDPGYVREQVLARDHGVCALCGLDTVGLQRETCKLDHRERDKREREFGIQWGRSTYWDADHIVAVAEGGGECDLDNYRTLCIPCHKGVTAALKRRLAAARNPTVPTPLRSADQLTFRLEGA